MLCCKYENNSSSVIFAVVPLSMLIVSVKNTYIVKNIYCWSDSKFCCDELRTLTETGKFEWRIGSRFF